MPESLSKTNDGKTQININNKYILYTKYLYYILYYNTDLMANCICFNSCDIGFWEKILLIPPMPFESVEGTGTKPVFSDFENLFSSIIYKQYK